MERTYRIVKTNEPLIHSWAGSDHVYTAEEKAREKAYNHEYYMSRRKKINSYIQRETKNAINAGRKAAVNNTVQKIGNSASNRNQKIDAKKLTKAALMTFGTVAVTSLVSRSINSGIDYAVKSGIKAINNVNWAEVVWKMEAAKKGLIYI